VSITPQAEFVFNDNPQASTGFSPFFANTAQHPRPLVLVTDTVTDDTGSRLADKLAMVHKELRENLKHAQDRMVKYYNAKHIDITFDVGDLVWLRTTNLSTDRQCKKLDFKKCGPFEILQKVSERAYRLKLLYGMTKMHNVFYVAMLERYYPNTIQRRIQSPPPPVIVTDKDSN
jgi:hypothetical protein